MADETPCERAARLRAAREEIILGRSAVMVDHDSGIGEKRRVQYTAANLPALDRLIADADRECAAQQGRRTRFAITGG